MTAKLKIKLIQIFVQAAKIAIGSSLAIVIAMGMELEFATSAGIITLLTLLTTKIETLRLSLYRMISLVISILISYLFIQHIFSEWIAFGIYIFLIVFFSNWNGWGPTISVNAVIGTHFLTMQDYSIDFILNEAGLVIIGVGIAILFNVFTPNNHLEKRILHNVEFTEKRIQDILEDITKFLMNEEVEYNIWDRVIELEEYIEHFIEQSYEFQNNSFKEYKAYYVHYFEMRSSQCKVLHNLHYDIKAIKEMHREAYVVAGYIKYINQFIFEMVDPDEQIEILETLFVELRKEKLPENQLELEGRVKLFHILFDIEEFLVFKRRFIKNTKHEWTHSNILKVK